MAFAASVVHPFVSAIADSGDATLLQPSNWNAAHTVTYSGMVSGGVLYGTSTTGVGTSALLTAGSPVLGGGAATAPLTDAGFTTTGTGATLVATLNGLTVTAAPTFSALTATRVPFAGTNGLLGDSANLVYVSGTGLTSDGFITAGTVRAGATGGTLAFSTTAGAGPTIAAGTATTAVSPFALTQTRNNNAVTHPGVTWTFTDTAVGATANLFTIYGGAAGTTEMLSLTKVGGLRTSNGAFFDLISSNAIFAHHDTSGNLVLYNNASQITGLSGGFYGWSSQAVSASGTDTALSRLSAGVVAVGTGAAGSIVGSLSLKTVTHSSAEVDTSYTYNQPATGATITTATGEQRTIIDPAGTIAALTLTTPPSPVNGQIWGFASTQIVTTLTITGTAGATVNAPPASMAVDSNYRMIYRATGTTWHPAP